MAARVREPVRGKEVLYVEHGVWYDQTQDRIHVTMDGMHLSYGPDSPRYEHYFKILAEYGRVYR